MPFAIVADLPLGTYHGAGQDGQPEPVPSVARLHAALLCAAGFGPRAVSTGPDSLDVREEDQAALRWLEENPPDSVAIPALQINIAYPVAYRDDGTIKRSRASASIKKLAKSPGGGTAVAGQFAWIWTEPPPPDIRGCPGGAVPGRRLPGHHRVPGPAAGSDRRGDRGHRRPRCHGRDVQHGSDRAGPAGSRPDRGADGSPPGRERQAAVGCRGQGQDG